MPFSNHSPPMSRHLPHCLVGTLAITPQGHDAAGQQPPMVVSFPSTVLTGYIVTGLIVSGYSVFGRLGLTSAQSCAETAPVTHDRGLWQPRSRHPGGEGAQPGRLGRTSRTALDLHRAGGAWATQPQPPQHPEDRRRPRRGCWGAGAGVNIEEIYLRTTRSKPHGINAKIYPKRIFVCCSSCFSLFIPSKEEKGIISTSSSRWLPFSPCSANRITFPPSAEVP